MPRPVPRTNPLTNGYDLCDDHYMTTPRIIIATEEGTVVQTINPSEYGDIYRMLPAAALMDEIRKGLARAGYDFRPET